MSKVRYKSVQHFSYKSQAHVLILGDILDNGLSSKIGVSLGVALKCRYVIQHSSKMCNLQMRMCTPQHTAMPTFYYIIMYETLLPTILAYYHLCIFERPHTVLYTAQKVHVYVSLLHFLAQSTRETYPSDLHKAKHSPNPSNPIFSDPIVRF